MGTAYARHVLCLESLGVKMTNGRIINLRLDLERMAEDMESEAIRMRAHTERLRMPNRQTVLDAGMCLAKWGDRLRGVLEQYAETLSGMNGGSK